MSRRKSRRVSVRGRRLPIGLPQMGGWAPGILTVGNLLAGFAAILMALEGRFLFAFWLVFAAAVLDGLDGRVARMTGAVTKFGGQLDALCDAVSFAVAPSLFAYLFGLAELGRVGWSVCFLFTACGVIRLARFSASASSHLDFVGLPVPMAAAIATVPAVTFGGEVLPVPAAWAYAAALSAAALLMVSTLRYPSFKKVSLAERPYRTLVGAAVILAGLVAAAEWFLPALFTVYLTLPVFRVFTGERGRRTRSEEGGDGEGGSMEGGLPPERREGPF